MSSNKKFVVFDFDGTLIRWQLYHAIFDELAKRNLVDKRSYQAVVESRHKWKTRESQNSFKAYERELVKCYKASLPNLTKLQFDNAVASVFQKHKGQVYVFTRELIKDLKEKGYFLIAISGSHMEAVELVARHYGFDDWEGTRFEIINNRFTGKFQSAFGDKSAILKTLIKKHNLSTKDSYAVGDSESDIPMLELADNPVVFNPTEKLFIHAKAKGWKIVIERKNVVYRLDHQKNKYSLMDEK